MSKRKSMAPRNPFVAVARFKKAGVHGKTEKALRRAARIETQRDLWPSGKAADFYSVPGVFDSRRIHQADQRKRIAVCFRCSVP